jgi:hypothetical protein
MPAFLTTTDHLLRGTVPAEAPGLSRPAILILFIFICGIAYGGIMGSFGGVTGDRLLQVLYSGLKVPMLLLVTFAISLPSFFVLNTLLGVRSDFADALRALISAQAVLTLVLLSLGPFTIFWYASSDHYRAAILFNGLMFAIASFGAQLVLRRSYAGLIARNPRHRALLASWLIIYTFVGIQMGWVLRPFIGDPELPTRFFREDGWRGNAYLIILEMIWHVLAG